MAKRLLRTLQDYQRRRVIPHCAVCSRPCCRLTDVVLEFDWPQLAQLYRIDTAKRTFDRSLQDGSGPQYVRKMDGRYFTHGSPCPAYDQRSKQCAVYSTGLKPQGCSDFPLYVDGAAIIADTRCEALDIDELLGQLQQQAPERVVAVRPDEQFPVIKRITLRRVVDDG
ncbi:MAG: YkgJ family cysteine cluster protein [Gammaproteobacteria bacterium]|nr:YkgJ family cysteine cluster protein [Gammaproteobacteria bacterium]